MSDPLPTDAAPGGDPEGQVDRDARIEQLLLAGLDHYFAGDHEQAINIWTRVVFIERGHGRARAYIEKARSALAERQRESEELLHRGIDAFNQGETHTARDLINQAVEEIGPNDVAMVFLERLNRLGPASVDAEGPGAVPVGRVRPHAQGVPTVAPRRPWFVHGFLKGAVLLAATTAIALAAVWLEQWFVEGPATRFDAVQIVKDEPLPVVRASDMALARARLLHGGGHLRDALATLDAIGLADPLRVEANALRSEIQRQLLAASHPAPVVSVEVPADFR